MFKVSTKNRITNVIPLPGVDEIESAVRGLINAVRASGYEHDQCDSLTRRLDYLIKVANTCKKQEDFTEILSQVQDVKSRFETKLKHKSRLPGIIHAQDRLRAYEDLSRELTELVERAQLQLSTSNWSMLTKHSAQLDSILAEYEAERNRKSIEQNFDTIRECDIFFDRTQSTWMSPSEPFVVEAGKVDDRRKSVKTHYRSGRLGKLRVVYISFSAHSDHAAVAEKAERELKQLSRARHLNVATVVGVTRGYDGLNGLIVAMDGAPIRKVLKVSLAGGFLARCIQGLSQVIDFCCEEDYSVGVDLFSGGITVAPDGHVTVLLSGVPVAPGGWSIPYWAKDPITNIVFRMYWEAAQACVLGDGTQAEPRSKLLEYLTRLDRSHLNELQLLKIAADCGLKAPKAPILDNWEPRLLQLAADCGLIRLDSQHQWYSAATPPFTIYSDDLVRVIDRQSPKAQREVLENAWEVSETGWEVLAMCTGVRPNKLKYLWKYPCQKCDCIWQFLPRTRLPYLTWVTSCPHKLLTSPTRYSGENWRHRVMERARNVSRERNIKLSHVSYVTHTSFNVTAEKLNFFEDPAPEALLYFHCSDTLRSSPRDFYGFYSTSPDPCAPSTGLPDTDWRFEYQIRYDTRPAVEDWGLRYQEALEASLSAIPGSYPGANVQELADDETE